MARRPILAALLLLLASPVQADAIVGSVRLSPPSRTNGGPDRFGVSSLRIEAHNTSTRPVRLRALSVKLKSRRVMDTEWTTHTIRIPGGVYLEGQADTGAPTVTIPPGRHTLIVRFERVGASAYHVHTAEVSIQISEAGTVQRGVLEVRVTMRRRHPRSH